MMKKEYIAPDIRILCYEAISPLLTGLDSWGTEQEGEDTFHFEGSVKEDEGEDDFGSSW